MSRAQPFLTPANVLTLSRLPLAALMWHRPSNRVHTLTITALAGLTDVLDGRLARSDPRGLHPSGAWLDPVCDKIFVLSALGAAASTRRPGPALLLRIASRELLQLPLTGLLLLRALHARRGPIDVRAAWIGKLATSVQFLAIGSMLLARKDRPPWTDRATHALARTAAVLGPAAAVYYYIRALDALERDDAAIPSPERMKAPLPRAA